MTDDNTAPVPAQRQDVFWVNSFIRGKSCLKVEDLAWVEVNVRKTMIPLSSYYRKNVPGFENSYIYDSASQIGTRGSRRLIGEYVLTGEEAKAGNKFDDTVLIFPRGVPLTWPAERPTENVEMPYRCLVPAKLEGLLAAGRCFSSDQAANSMFNVISHCMSTPPTSVSSSAPSLSSSDFRRVRDKSSRKMTTRTLSSLSRTCSASSSFLSGSSTTASPTPPPPKKGATLRL